LLQQSLRWHKFIEMPLGMTVSSGFFGAMSISAIAMASIAMEKILDLVDSDKADTKQHSAMP